jgi:hypothetical protein
MPERFQCISAQRFSAIDHSEVRATFIQELINVAVVFGSACEG